MDYAIELSRTYELNTLETIKNALINEKRLTPNEEIIESFLASLRGKSERTKERMVKKVTRRRLKTAVFLLDFGFSFLGASNMNCSFFAIDKNV